MSKRRTELAAHRKSLGLTQEGLAERLGVELSTVGRWERGLVAPQPCARPTLAKVLDITLERLSELLMLDTSVVRSSSDEKSSSRTPAPCTGIQQLRRLVDVYDLPDDGPVRPLRELRREVETAVVSRLNSDYGSLIDRLPVLLPELTRAFMQAHGHERAEGARILAQAYRSADAIADKFGHYDLSARIIEIMRWAARESGDPLTIATADYVRAEVFFASGQLGDGRRMLEAAADHVSARSSAEAVAVYGSLHSSWVIQMRHSRLAPVGPLHRLSPPSAVPTSTSTWLALN